MFATLEETHKLLNRNRRIARQSGYKRTPKNFIIHYTLILATSEYLLAIRRPESLLDARSCVLPTTWKARPYLRTRTQR